MINDFFVYIFDKLKEQSDIVKELLITDNKIMETNFNIEDFYDFIKKNINCINFYKETKDSTLLILYEGNPIETLKLLNDFHINKGNIILFPHKNYVAMNLWLIEESINYCNSKGINSSIKIDLSSNYNSYLKRKDIEFVLVGEQEFIITVSQDLEKEPIIL